MSNMPPPLAYPAAPVPSPRTSITAVLSLICGLLFCTFGVTSFLAVILGFIGIVKTSKPNVKGRGLALAGLFLGVIALAGWSYLGYKTYVVGAAVVDKIKTAQAEAMTPGKAAGTELINNLASGNKAAATPLVAPTVDPGELSRAGAQIRALGKITSFNPGFPEVEQINGVWHYTLKGSAVFEKGVTQPVVIKIVKESNGIKVEGLQIGNDIHFGN